MSPHTLPTPEELEASLQQRGHTLIRGIPPSEAQRLLDALGSTLQVTDVRPDSAHPSLVKARQALAPHTDHHGAHRIAWHCMVPAARGGHTLLIDGYEALSALSAARRQALRGVILQEHDVLGLGHTTHPMLVGDGSRPQLYYAYWLAHGLTPSEQDAFDAFARAIEFVPRLRVRLERHDLLLIDNHRMLHGREAFDGPRHLVRTWLGVSP